MNNHLVKSLHVLATALLASTAATPNASSNPSPASPINASRISSSADISGRVSPPETVKNSRIKVNRASLRAPRHPSAGYYPLGRWQTTTDDKTLTTIVTLEGTGRKKNGCPSRYRFNVYATPEAWREWDTAGIPRYDKWERQHNSVNFFGHQIVGKTPRAIQFSELSYPDRAGTPRYISLGGNPGTYTLEQVFVADTLVVPGDLSHIFNISVR